MLKTRDILMLLCGGGLAGALFLLAPASAQHAAVPTADPAAVNAAPVATQHGTSPIAGNRACTCPGDFNGDNLINTADLVNFLAVFGTQCAPDTDGDGVPNAQDNCPNVANANQADQDADGVGDVCDNCPTVSNPGQQDSNGNGIGDACENPGCTPGSTQPCASGFPGVCSAGIKTCQANGTWGPCLPNIQPNSQPEVCNGQDDDCDGQVDEGNPCPAVPNGSNNCTGSGCQLVCSPGFANCDGNNANGCEVNINTSTNNCGGCGIVCNLPNATATCVNGVCAIGSCNAGFFNCDGNPANGCEVNINTSTSNCGGCGIVCNLPNATAACVNGQCTIGSCNAGFANCNGITADGCEVNINTGTSNCGGCGIVCNLPNATATCINGQCRIGSCNVGWADCDNNPANGCETNLQTSTSNCGLCGRVCAVGPHVASVSCVSGTCVITGCQAGWFNSNGVYADGCESTTP